jgi:low affinity Fe/Cu permease
MGRLKKRYHFINIRVNGSSITETIVATTIIIIVFTIATLSLNTILQNRVENDISIIERKIDEIIYKSTYQKLKTPTSFEDGNWVVNISKENNEAADIIVFEAIHKKSKKKLVKRSINYEN